MISGRNYALPWLPTVPGDEGVGDVVEIGNRVGTVDVGDRVIISSRLLGTWQLYGIYNEREVHIVTPKLPIPEASMLSIAPCMAYRMIKDFVNVQPGDTIIQNAANSPCGQCIIQLCKRWGIKTVNVVANHCEYEQVKEHLLSLGADFVYTLPEAEAIKDFKLLSRPILALNCLGGRHEDLMLKLVEREGTIVYYGGAYYIPIAKQFLRCDVNFFKFHLNDWDLKASSVSKDIMLRDIVQLMMTGHLIAPIHRPVELKNYVAALRNTSCNEAFAISNYIFDFTMP